MGKPAESRLTDSPGIATRKYNHVLQFHLLPIAFLHVDLGRADIIHGWLRV